MKAGIPFSVRPLIKGLRQRPRLNGKNQDQITSPKRLNIRQVKQMVELGWSHFPSQEVYPDIFLFCVFTELGYQDTMDLK